MGRYTVPVIVTHIATGEEIRYPSVKEAALATGVSHSSIYKASVSGYQTHGYFVRREDDWRCRL